MNAKLVDTGRLACTRHATDTNAYGVAAIRQTLVDNLLRLGLMVRIDAFHQRDSLREDGDIALDDALNHLSSSKFTTTYALTSQIWIDDTRLLDATIDLQACIF